MRIFRIIVAAPFILIGALFYKFGELISGEIYTRHEQIVRKNVIFEHNLHQANKMNEARMRTGGKGFRTPRQR
jgi:hypothetical protein